MTVKISGKNTWIVLLCFPIKLLGKLYCEITDIWKTLIQNLFIVFKNIYSIHVYTIITINNCILEFWLIISYQATTFHTKQIRN